MLISCSSVKPPKQGALPAPAPLPLSQVRPLGNSAADMPRCIIYKTRADYSDKVPVTMNDARSEIVSYPAPGDVYYSGALAVPLRLADGYLLDRRGIGVNTVFTDYTYSRYAALPAVPSRDELMRHVIDKYPFQAIYVTDIPLSGSKNLEALSSIIAHGFLNCKKVRLPVEPVLKISDE